MAESRSSTVLTQAAAPAAAYTVDFSVADQDTIVVWWTLTNATAAGDLTAATCLVRPCDPSGVVMNTTLAEESVVVTGAFTSPVAATAKRYNVRGISKLQLRFTTTAVRDIKVYVNSYWG